MDNGRAKVYVAEINGEFSASKAPNTMSSDMEVMEADPLQKIQVRTPDSTDSSNITRLNMKTVCRPISTSEFNTSGCEEKDLEESRFQVIMAFQDFLSPGTGAVALITAAGASLTMRTAAGGDDDSSPTCTSSRMEGEYCLGDEGDSILVTEMRRRCSRRDFHGRRRGTIGCGGAGQQQQRKQSHRRRFHFF